MLSSLSEIKKALIAALGVALTALTFAHQLPFVPASWEATIGVLLAVLTPVLTWLAGNTTANAARVAGRSVSLKGEKTAA